MPARLIVNADDFGLTGGINRAIVELHGARVLTSATLMATGPAFGDAVKLAHAHRELGVGCHIVLTDGVPASPPKLIPTLLGPDGKTFRPSLSTFIQALLLGRIRDDEIALEALAQIDKLQRAGISITHVDTHKHTHLFSAVTRPLLAAAQRAGIRAIRNPFEPQWSLALKQGTTSRRAGVRITNLFRPRFAKHAAIHEGRVLTTDGTLAISATGHLTAAALAQTLHGLPASGTYELCCHPGYNDRDLDSVATRLRAHREEEREALLAEIPRIVEQPNAPTLIHYGELSSPA